MKFITEVNPIIGSLILLGIVAFIFMVLDLTKGVTIPKKGKIKQKFSAYDGDHENLERFLVVEDENNERVIQVSYSIYYNAKIDDDIEYVVLKGKYTNFVWTTEIK